jgi:Peptidase family M48
VFSSKLHGKCFLILALCTTSFLGGCTRTTSSCSIPQGRRLSGITYNKVQEETRELLKAIQHLYAPASLLLVPTVVDTPLPYAYVCNSQELVLSTGILETLKSREERMFVVAHELGHLFLEHKAITGTRDVLQEQEADDFALFLITSLGMSRRKAIRALLRFQSHENTARYTRLLIE